jgi:hypothetical protein
VAKVYLKTYILSSIKVYHVKVISEKWKKMSLFLLRCGYLTPLSPLQPEALILIQRYLWLERGSVFERG